MARPNKYQPLADFALGMVGDDEEERETPLLKLTPEREEALEKWKADPWTFLTGRNPDDDKPLIWTFDQRDTAQTLKPFPANLDYLHYLTDLLQGEQYMAIEKCSQMIVTTTIVLWCLWLTLTRFGHKVLLSKHKEAEAETILAEKMFEPWNHMPEWVKKQWPLKLKPKNRAESKPMKSYILGLPENAAAADARGQTYQVGLIDEAEYQEMLGALISAMLPRAGKVFWWSTPASGGAGVTVFRSYLKDDPIKFRPELAALKKKYSHVRGMSTRRNEDRDVTICRIEHTADPAKRSEEWLRKARMPYSSHAEFKREILIDRTSNEGKPFYPQFSENPARFMLKCPSLIKGTIFRGWDFGGQNPACVWGIWSKQSKRFWVLRELLGYDCDTYQFRDLVKYLSGQLSLESLQVHTRAMQMLEELAQDKAYPPVPWFEGKNAFLDFAGHEGVMTGRGLTKQGQAKTAAEILALGDIYLYSYYTPQSARTEIINGLSRVRDDGWPALLIDPACPTLWTGLVSGIVYARATPQNPDPGEPAKDAVYSHLHEALGYALTNVVRLEDADSFKASMGPDGQIIMPTEPDSQLLSYLTTRMY